MTARGRLTAGIVAGCFGLAGVVLPAAPSHALTVGVWTNCDHVHQRWPHGVGRLHAVDHTSGTPVTSFKHSNRLYRKAMNHNGGLDRDHDHIACEAL